MPTALDALMAAMVALAFVAPGTLNLGDLVAPRMLPILVVAVSQTAIGLSRRSLARSVIGSALLVAVGMIAVRGPSAQPSGAHRLSPRARSRALRRRGV